MVAFAWWSTDRWRPRGRSEWREVAVGGLFFITIHHALLFAGQQYVTAAVAAVVVSTVPVLVAGLSRGLLPSERLSPRGLVGLLLGLVGVGIIARPDPGNLLSVGVLGIVLVFGAAAAWAVGAVLVERDRTTLPALSMQAWMMVVGAPLLHLASFLAPGETIVAAQFNTETLLALVYLGPISGGLGYLLYFGLQDRLGPTEINLVSYAVPAFAAVVGFFVLAEPIEPATVVGFAVILAGFALVKFEAVRAEVRRLRHDDRDVF
jgi:drug/metabolite transporter (DMT)-like permease